MQPKRFPFIFERLGLGFLGLVLPLAFYPSAEDAYRLPQLIAFSLALLCLCVAWSSPRGIKLGPAMMLAALFFCLRLVSNVLGGFKLEWVLEQGEYALLFFWAVCHLDNPELAKRLKAAFVVGAVLAAAYAILQSYGLDPFAAGRANQGFGARSYSTLGNPDFWGGYLVLVIPLAWDYLPILALFILALVLSQTRAAWLAFGIGGLILVWKGRPKQSRFAIGFAVFAMLFYSFPNPLNPQGLQSAGRLASSADVGHADAEGRFFMDHVAWDIALAHPVLGAGGGNFTDAYLAEQGRLMATPEDAAQPYRFTPQAHNDWLQLAAESGLPALLFFGAIVFLALRSSWRLKRWWLVALLASFSVDAMLHFPLAIVPSAVITWAALGWALSGGGEGRNPEIRGIRWAGVALCLIAILVFTRQLYASALLNRGMSLSLVGRMADAEGPLRASVWINPSDQRTWMRLGLNADNRGDLVASEAAFEHCQDTPEGLADLGLAEAKQGRLDEGKATSLKSIALNPRNVEAIGNLGKIEYLRGDIPGAETIYKQGLVVQPDWEEGHFNLAAIYINTGRKAEAVEQLHELLQGDPTNAQALALLHGLQ